MPPQPASSSAHSIGLGFFSANLGGHPVFTKCGRAYDDCHSSRTEGREHSGCVVGLSTRLSSRLRWRLKQEPDKTLDKSLDKTSDKNRFLRQDTEEQRLTARRGVPDHIAHIPRLLWTLGQADGTSVSLFLDFTRS